MEPEPNAAVAKLARSVRFLSVAVIALAAALACFGFALLTHIFAHVGKG